MPVVYVDVFAHNGMLRFPEQLQPLEKETVAFGYRARALVEQRVRRPLAIRDMRRFR